MSAFWTFVRQVLENLDSSTATRTVERVVTRARVPRRMEGLEPEVPRDLLSRPRLAERTERIRAEILMIAPHFSRHEGICYDEDNCDWLMIPKYPLPEKWRARWCKLLILFPNTYPLSPPIGFYLSRKHKLKDGSRDSHLIGFGHHDAPDLQEQGWQWYCCYLRDGVGGWRPSARYDQPDNLRTFLNTVREVLTND